MITAPVSVARSIMNRGLKRSWQYHSASASTRRPSASVLITSTVWPDIVVTTMSGQTVEVINTDAEGRLVLADAIWYCQERFKPRFIIDLATLTGAIIVALGKDVAGLFSNNDALAERLLAASKTSGDTLWRMPLPPQYDRNIDSDV